MTLQKVIKTFTFSFSRGCVLPQLLVPRLAAEFNSIGIRGGVERRTPYHAVAILYIYILYTLYFISHNHEIQQKRHKPTIPEPYHTKHFLPYCTCKRTVPCCTTRNNSLGKMQFKPFKTMQFHTMSTGRVQYHTTLPHWRGTSEEDTLVNQKRGTRLFLGTKTD